MKTPLKLAGLMGVVVVLFACLGAGVTGLFTQVNSVNGYQVAGSAGSSGQVLCSNGTYFATPCSLPSAINLTGTGTGCTFSSDGNGLGCSTTVTLPSGMPDTSYTAVCTPQFSNAVMSTESAMPSLGLGWSNSSTTAITVNEQTNNGSSVGYGISSNYGVTIYCVAHHT